MAATSNAKNRRQPLPFASARITGERRRGLFGAPPHPSASAKDQDQLEPVPVVTPDPVWALADVIGSEQAGRIEETGEVVIHVVGDTGFGKYPGDNPGPGDFGKPNPEFKNSLHRLIDQMDADLTPDQPGQGPAFLFHLGDVVYFDNTRPGYYEQFYDPWESYSGKVVAIPGNHDCEVHLGHQQFTLQAFRENFCPPAPSVPPAARGIQREMSAQPGVYWRLDTKFVQIVGLCTNAGENFGAVKGDRVGPDMYDWFLKTLKEVAASQKAEGDRRRALVVGLHHPPYTSGNHPPSDAMRQDMDDAFDKAGVWPDLVLAAHDHNYQRYTRFVDKGDSSIEIPYLVVGGGGRFTTFGDHDPQMGRRGQVQLDSFGHGNGYAILTARPRTVSVEYHPVDRSERNMPDHVTVDLLTRKVR